jgi:hypothetical protein
VEACSLLHNFGGHLGNTDTAEALFLLDHVQMQTYRSFINGKLIGLHLVDLDSMTTYEIPNTLLPLERSCYLYRCYLAPLSSTAWDGSNQKRNPDTSNIG